MSSGPSSGFLAIAALMFVSGIGIPLFAAFNSNLGREIGGPVAATTVTFAIGLALALLLLLLTGGAKLTPTAFDQPWIWFGAVFVLFYAIAIAFAAPRIGLGNAVFFVLLGQIVAAAAIDHFALFGTAKTVLTSKRVLGIAVMAFGLWLARKPM